MSYIHHCLYCSSPVSNCHSHGRSGEYLRDDPRRGLALACLSREKGQDPILGHTASIDTREHAQKIGHQLFQPLWIVSGVTFEIVSSKELQVGRRMLAQLEQI